MPAPANNFVDFKAVKQSVSMIQILEHYGFMQKLKRNADSLSGPCPLHDGHTEGKFKVSISKNCWHCFGRCKSGGNVLDFVSRREGIGIREAAILIVNWFNLSGISGRVELEKKKKGDSPVLKSESAKNEPERNKPLGFTLNHLDMSHPYLAERGLSQETATTFGFGFCKKGMLTGRIAIPVHNLTGELVAYIGRWPGQPPEGKKKYKLPDDFKKSLEVFNLHRAVLESSEKPLVVVQGIFDCVRIWQAGFSRIVAIMGNVLSEEQAALLTLAVSAHGRIILMFNENESGRMGLQSALMRVSSICQVRTIRLPKEGLRLGDLSQWQLLKLLKS